MDQVPLLVLGADIDGLAAALSLAHQGFPVHLLDREPHPGPVGDGDAGTPVVPLPPGATRELAVLGLLDAVARYAVEPRALLHADAVSGEVLRTADLGEEVRHRFGHPYLLVRRATLRAVLGVAADADEMIVTEYGRPVTSVEDLHDVAVVRCADGTVYRAEALVGADGPASRARTLLGGGHPASVPYALLHVPATLDVAEDPGEIRLWSSPTVHVTRAPAPDGGADGTVVTRLPDDGGPARTAGGALDQLLAGHHRTVRAAVGGADRAVPSRVHRGYEPLGRWIRNRVAVLGSAAHPMVPHTADGPGQTLTDAGALGLAFDRADGRILAALADYERLRAGPSARAAARAVDFADLCHADGLVRRLRDRLWSGTGPDSVAEVVGPVHVER